MPVRWRRRGLPARRGNCSYRACRYKYAIVVGQAPTSQDGHWLRSRALELSGTQLSGSMRPPLFFEMFSVIGM